MASVYNRGTRQRPNWYASVKEGAKWKAYPTQQTTKGAAEKVADEMQARVRRGELAIPDEQETERKAATVADIAARFLLEYHRGRIKDMVKYRAVVKRDLDLLVLPHVGAVPAAALRRPQIVSWVQTLTAEGYTPHTVNRAIARLSAIYSWATTMDVLDCKNPVARFERLTAPPADEHFTLPQVHKILALADLPPMVAFALYTGCRKGEIFGLTWDRVRFDLGAIEVRTSYATGSTKTGKPRTIPIHPELVPILKAWQEKCPTPDGLVFPICQPDRHRVSRWRMGEADELAGLDKVLVAAGLDVPKVHPWHALRHTFATLAIEAGVARDAVESILGHRGAGSATTAGYLHVSLEHLTREIGKLTLRPPTPAPVRRLHAV